MDTHENTQNDFDSLEDADLRMNTDENAVGTTLLNNPIEEENEIQKIKDELAER